MFVDFNILNQLGSPSINSNTFANRPAAGQTGRLFVSTDTFEIYRDNGTTWDLIGGPGSSTITGTGTATQVAYFTSSQAIGSSANLFWDNTSGFLGVATATPSARIEAVKTDGIGIYANYTTNAGSGSSATALWAKNVTNSSGFAAVIEETTPNTTAGQYPLLIKHSLSSGTAGVGMGTGLHFQLPDDAGTFKTTQLTIETINAAAATYATRYRFNVQSNGSSTPVAYINATGLGIFTATPSAALDVHSTGTIAQFNTTSATGNTYIAFQRTGTGLWRVGDTYNAGNNQFEIHNTVLAVDAVNINAATNKSSWQAQQTYTTGLARGNYFDFNLSVAAGGSFSSPNAITALGASLDLTLAGNATIPSGARSGLDAYNSIAFTGAGTLTHTQGTQIRAYSNVTAGWAFNGSATGTITHLAGLRALFPDNSGSAVNVTNNYALLLNDQTANTGTVTYTNRWGVYQEGASDLNYFAANTLIGTTTNAGNYKLQVNGDAYVVEFLRFSANTKGIIIGTNGAVNPYIQGGSGNQLFLGTSNNPRISILSTGEVGIGTTTPEQLLDLFTSGANPSTNLQIRASRTGYGNVRFNLFTYAGGSLSTDRFTIQNNAGVNILNITGNELVGIGTISPSSKLSVVGPDASTSTIQWNNSGGRKTGYLYSDSAGIAIYDTNLSDAGIYLAQNSQIDFRVNGSQRVIVKSNGNTLIGTTTDDGYKLQVNGSISIPNGNFYRANRNTGGASIPILGFESGTDDLIQVFSNTWKLRGTGGVGDEKITVSSSGTATFQSSITTGTPNGGTAAAWKFGRRVAAAVVLDTTQYIELDVAGTLYKLAIVT